MRLLKCKVFILFIVMTISTNAQGFYPSPNDTLNPIEILEDKSVMLQLYAPKAEKVSIIGDIPEHLRKAKIENIGNGVWKTVVGPLKPGSYRYQFVVDGIPVVNPLSNDISESNMNVWSIFHVNGAQWMDYQNVPHGLVSEATYYSETLQKQRRMHIYFPPEYSTETIYPVFYLLHGAFDNDDAWTSIGRAAVIMDNLIAEEKAVPMIIVMPDGHTQDYRPNDPNQKGRISYIEFVDEFNNDVKPFVEANFPVSNKREKAAIAGLSMGGYHTLNIAIPKLQEYAYVGVFSSGIFLNKKGDLLAKNAVSQWEEDHIVALDKPDLKEGLELFWFAIGEHDFLIKAAKQTVSMLEKHKFDIVYKETKGAHEWRLWREYLHEFAQQLFK